MHMEGQLLACFAILVPRQSGHPGHPGLCPQLCLTGHPPVCPGQGDTVPTEDPSCSWGQLMGSVPLIPVPIQPTCSLGDICSSVPTKRDQGMPCLASDCCVLRRAEATSLVSKEEDWPEARMRGTSRAVWSAGAGSGS